jgi:hypothetical protein
VNAVGIIKKRPLNFEEIIEVSLNMDVDTQLHMMWKLNTDSSIPIDQRIVQAITTLKRYNSIRDNNFNFNYSTDNNYVKLDLSRNKTLIHAVPLYSLPLDELDISGSTNMQISLLVDYFKSTLSVLNLSGNMANINKVHTSHGKFHTIIAKNTFFTADKLNNIPNLRYLDIQGASTKNIPFYGSKTLEHLNIAFSDIKNFNFLSECTALKTLVIDNTMMLPKFVLDQLHKRGTQITIKNTSEIEDAPVDQNSFDILKAPGILQAEDYSSMMGIRTDASKDTDESDFVGWWEADDYLNYDIHTNKAGEYKISFRVSGKSINFNLLSEDKILCRVSEKNISTDWQDWQSIDRNITLPNGYSTLTIQCTGPGWNINWMKFELIEPK